MSLLEWMFERRNPGPVGDIDVGHPAPLVARPWVLALRAGFALAILGLMGYVIVASEHRGWAAILLALYLVAGYFIDPRPDPRNVGLLGGFVDHPLRWSDDANRGLLFVKVFLWPARLAVTGLRDAIDYTRGRRTIVLYRRDDDGRSSSSRP